MRFYYMLAIGSFAATVAYTTHAQGTNNASQMSSIHYSIPTNAQITVTASKQIEDSIIKKMSSPGETWWEKVLPVISGALLGGILSTLAGAMVAKQTAKKELEIANLNKQSERELEILKASIETSGKVFDIHQNQFRDFYAPLHALLQQSRGVADKLAYHVYSLSKENKWPSEAEPDGKTYRFGIKTEQGEIRLVEDTNEADMKLARLYVNTPGSSQGEWTKFRMLDSMPLLKANSETAALVKRTMDIGQKKVDIISNNAGLAYAQEEPSDLYGAYLAHFAVLSAKYNDEKASTASPESQRVGYYPHGLDKHVEDEYIIAKNKIKEYETLAIKIQQILHTEQQNIGRRN